MTTRVRKPARRISRIWVSTTIRPVAPARRAGIGGAPAPHSDMILVDTSSWIDHPHRSDPTLIALLEERRSAHEHDVRA
jgi:hypothetical protein